MFCIAAFIILAILGIFSVRYRKLAADAWKCVARKATLRKCDTSFKEDTKARLLGRLVPKHPRLARFLDRWIEVLSFVFVLLMIWSVVVVAKSGLNLFVYDTCNPDNSESCSLGAEACSIETATPKFWSSLRSGDLLDWGQSQAEQFGETLGRLPDRLKKWNPAEYTTASNTYYRPYDAGKPTAIEIIDPGCKFCAKLYRNLKQAGVDNRYNLTYMVYPIPNPKTPGSYKFSNSYLLASYLESIKLHPLKDGRVPADWQILNRLFTWEDPQTRSGYQFLMDYSYSPEQAEQKLKQWLGDVGYSQEQLQEIADDAKSQKVKDSIARQRKTVEDEIKTVKIPTLLLGSRRFDGVVGPEKLN